MAEAIALGASIIAIIQIADRVIGLCKFYLQTVHDAPADIRAILIETSTMKMVLESIQFLSSCNDGTSKMLRGLSGPDGPIQGCQNTITQMEGLFPTIYAQGPRGGRSKRQKVKATLAYLAWPLKGDRPKKLVEELNRLKATIGLALTTESSHDIKDIKKQTTKIHEILSVSEQRQVYKWLQTTDPTPLHHRVCKQYEPGTGNWMLRSPEWMNWLQGKSRCVWIYGIPGAGKTVLISHLIENLMDHYKASTPKKCTYVYYYCYFGHNQEEAAPFLRWTINRLCREADHVPTYLYKLFQHGGEPSLAELLCALEAILEEFDNVYIVVDAIDESMPREDLLRVLRDLATDSRFRKVQLLATSRQYIDIENVMELISEPVSMLNPLLNEDIKLYVRSQLESNPKFKHWAPHLVEEVLEALATKAKGMFRWVVCQLHTLQRLKGESAIVRIALVNLPKTLDETYERIFLAIPDEDRMIVHEALKWIYYHNRVYDNNISCPILLQAVERSMPESSSSVRNYLLNEELLRELCGCLITVVSEERKYRHIIRCTIRSASFAHYTVWEFLASGRIFDTPAAFFVVLEEKTVLKLTKTAMLSVLDIESSDLYRHNLYDISEGDEMATLINEEFDAYSIVTSILATREFDRELSDHNELSTLVFRLLDPSKSHYPAFRLVTSQVEAGLGLYNTELKEEFWRLDWNTPSKSADAAILTNLLQFNGASELSKKFLERINIQEVLQIQLDLDKAEYIEDRDFKTYEFQGSIVELFATGYDCRSLIQLLEVGSEFIDYSLVLLWCAGFHEHWDKCNNTTCGLSKSLQLGVNPNFSGYAVTPLQIAAACWDIYAVELLLEAGADPNGTGDSDGIVWKKDTRLARFNHLRGVSPTRLCRQFACTHPDFDDEFDEAPPKIEATLLQYGARPCPDTKMLDSDDPSRISWLEEESESESELAEAESGPESEAGNEKTVRHYRPTERHPRMRISALLS
ncbi:hypothetical protein BDZ45DRAFT_587267 [Acephala macrosclerotiorum]|nr:hypothetical protein BDZ45DRAFT_587267 [Acephala macrosclerotiorum]